MYSEMMFVTIDVDEFAFWTSHFVPKGYHAKQAYGKCTTLNKPTVNVPRKHAYSNGRYLQATSVYILLHFRLN